jgi:hypothetical protein
MSSEIPLPIGFAIIAIVIFIVWQIYQRKIKKINQMPDIPRTIPSNGFEVPVLATFTGLKSLPRHESVTYNNLNPYLTIFDDRIEFRVLLKDSILLAELEYIDIWETFATRNLQVYVKDEEDVFIANLFKKKNLSKVLDYFSKKGVPLSNRAKAFLRKFRY